MVTPWQCNWCGDLKWSKQPETSICVLCCMGIPVGSKDRGAHTVSHQWPKGARAARVISETRINSGLREARKSKTGGLSTPDEGR